MNKKRLDALGTTMLLAGTTGIALSPLYARPTAAATVLPSFSCTTSVSDATHAGAACGANFVSATAFTDINNPSSGSDASLTYYAEVTGPSTENIAAVLTDYMNVSNVFHEPFNGQNDLVGKLSITDADTGTTVYETTYGYTGIGGFSNGNWTITTISKVGNLGLQSTNLSLSSNTLYEITLTASAATTGIDSFATMYVDPSLSIDSATDPGYSVVVSPGILNAVTPVPLPASAWLLVSGIGGLRALARRKCATKKPCLAA
jgi:hypothetical protein